MNLEALRLLIAPLLKATEFEGKTYFAGGCVRDYLLSANRGGEFRFSADWAGIDDGLDSRLRGNDKVVANMRKNANCSLNDVDICVNLPEGGIKLAKHLHKLLNGEKLCTHPKFGTASFAYKSVKLEFVATRRETYSPGNRYPKVEFGSLEDDVMRRDFTINALLMEITVGTILDLCGQGLNDLISGIIRCVGEPVKKYNEDPLRMLRAIRFGLRFGFTIEHYSFQALESEVQALQTLSFKQIEGELSKMLQYSPKEDVVQLLNLLHWMNVPKISNQVSNW